MHCRRRGKTITRRLSLILTIGVSACCYASYIKYLLPGSGLCIQQLRGGVARSILYRLLFSAGP